MDSINQSTINKRSLYLIVGGILFLGIGIYHLLLPSVYNWREFTSTLPDLIEWGVYAINFLMSMLMIILGIATLYTVKLGSSGTRDHILLYLICLIFWFLNLAYQVVVPTPIPEHLLGLKIGFLIPPVLCVIIYALPLYAYYKQDR